MYHDMKSIDRYVVTFIQEQWSQNNKITETGNASHLWRERQGDRRLGVQIEGKLFSILFWIAGILLSHAKLKRILSTPSSRSRRLWYDLCGVWPLPAKLQGYQHLASHWPRMTFPKPWQSNSLTSFKSFSGSPLLKLNKEHTALWADPNLISHSLSPT